MSHSLLREHCGCPVGRPDHLQDTQKLGLPAGHEVRAPSARPLGFHSSVFVSELIFSAVVRAVFVSITLPSLPPALVVSLTGSLSRSAFPVYAPACLCVCRCLCLCLSLYLSVSPSCWICLCLSAFLCLHVSPLSVSPSSFGCAFLWVCICLYEWGCRSGSLALALPMPPGTRS